MTLKDDTYSYKSDNFKSYSSIPLFVPPTISAAPMPTVLPSHTADSTDVPDLVPSAFPVVAPTLMSA